MYTKPKLIPTLILSIALAAGLSACSVQVLDPDTTTPPSPTASPEGSDDGTDVGSVASGECDGKDVEISQDSAQVILTGRCGVVNVTATSATVNVESADSIIITGLDNTIIVDDEITAVTIVGDGNSYSADGVDTLKVQGNENEVVLNTASDVSISGNTNFVQWSDGIGYSNDTGTGNTVVGP